MIAPERTGREEHGDAVLLKAVAQIIEAKFLVTFGTDRLNAVKRAAVAAAAGAQSCHGSET